jgi:hypothetical protein
VSEISIVTPIVELALQDLRQLQREHDSAGLRLRTTPLQGGSEWALNGDGEALVGALLQLAIECLTIHTLAEAGPNRPVASVLAEAVHLVKRS